MRKRSLTACFLFAYSLISCGGDSATTPVAPTTSASEEILSGTGVVINEFRTRGPNGEHDEFIELRNDSPASIDIGGWHIHASDTAGATTLLRTIGATGGTPGEFSGTDAARTTLGPGCHYLLVNFNGYRGVADNTYSIGIPDAGGLAIIDESGTTIDAVGLSVGSAFKEGTPLSAFPGTNSDHSYKRTGNDTNNNANDFSLSSPSTEKSRLTTCLVR